MARIDRFIKPLHQAGGQSVIMKAGEKILLQAADQQKAMTAQTASSRQILDFLREILPVEKAAAVEAGQDATFDYSSPFGSVQVVVAHPGGSLEARLIAVSGQEQPAAEAAAAPAIASTATSPDGAERAMQGLFRKMIEQGCSDLHLSTGNPPLFRKDGEIVALGEDSALAADKALEMLLSIASPRYRDEFEAAHDSDFSYEIPGLARFRCNLFMDRRGPGGVFRVIPTKIPTAEDLGLSKAVIDLCHLNKGLVVVTGPTGSGKSTTLAAMIDYINTNRNAHIITIEDPIEFVHQNKQCLINQREVGNHTRGFKEALRAALREDPDIVLVGEMRDLETMAIAIETAETGHLVFGTLHTSTAPSTVDRIIDQFPPDRQAQVRTMLSESLEGVISQTLCKKIGGGRVAAYEVLIGNSAVSNLIREGKTFQIQSIMQTAKNVGMVCLNESLAELVRGKKVSPEEALAKAVSKAELKTLLDRAGVRMGQAAAAGQAG